MANDTGESERPQMEDYGSPDGDTGSGGQGGHGGQFGEVGDTGVGTDLTATMEGDPLTGMVKGGQPGDDSAAGPGQYGGETGGLGSLSGASGGSSVSRTEGMKDTGSGDSDSEHGHFGGDGPESSERPNN